MIIESDNLIIKYFELQKSLTKFVQVFTSNARRRLK